MGAMARGRKTTVGEMFKRRALDPETGLRAGDWYAVGALLLETPGGRFPAAQVVTVMDVASGFVVGHATPERAPAALSAAEVISALAAAFAAHGPPAAGVCFSVRALASSLEMLSDEWGCGEGETLRRLGIVFGPMGAGTRAAIREWVRARGLRCEFGTDGLGPPG